MKPLYRNGLIALAAILFLGIGIYVQRYYLPSHTDTSLEVATTTVPVDGGVVTIVGRPGVDYTVTEVPPEALPAPDFHAMLTFGTTVSKEVQASLNAQLLVVQATLAQNKQDFSAWLELGHLRKSAGDYKGAAEIWEYVAVLWPKEVVPYNNLGDLYMNFIKDYAKAERNYKKIITLQPNYIDAYSNLFTLYRYVYKTNTTAALDIINQGLVANPGNTDLLALKAQYQQAHAQ